MEEADEAWVVALEERSNVHERLTAFRSCSRVDPPRPCGFVRVRSSSVWARARHRTASERRPHMGRRSHPRNLDLRETPGERCVEARRTRARS
jgi:hypothetical protein